MKTTIALFLTIILLGQPKPYGKSTLPYIFQLCQPGIERTESLRYLRAIAEQRNKNIGPQQAPWLDVEKSQRDL